MLEGMVTQFRRYAAERHAWGVNDFTQTSAEPTKSCASSTEGEWWNFYGNPKDFQSTRAFLDSNGGSGGIPYFAGSCAGDCTSLPACIRGYRQRHL